MALHVVYTLVLGLAVGQAVYHKTVEPAAQRLGRQLVAHLHHLAPLAVGLEGGHVAPQPMGRGIGGRGIGG